MQIVEIATCAGPSAYQSFDGRSSSSGLAIADLRISSEQSLRKKETYPNEAPFSFGLFVMLAGVACAQEQAATPVGEVKPSYSLRHATSGPAGNQLTRILHRSVSLMALDVLDVALS